MNANNTGQHDLNDTPITDGFFDGDLTQYAAEFTRDLERQLNMADALVAKYESMIDACRNSVVAACAEFHNVGYIKQLEAERDAMAFSRPYDCYWSRRALAAEKELEIWEPDAMNLRAWLRKIAEVDWPVNIHGYRPQDWARKALGGEPAN